MTAAVLHHGGVSVPASSYADHRPGYADTVLTSITALGRSRGRPVDACDVGAGTGICSRMLAAAGCRVAAVEPNEAMRREGEARNEHLDISWTRGSGEATGMPDDRFDLVTMASAFHRTDFDAATREFARILKPGGYFAALWNPRVIERTPSLQEIENKMRELAPDMQRVSSGRSAFCNGLTRRLEALPQFAQPLYLEACHMEIMTPERYLGIWQTDNDVRVQMGEARFAAFLDYIDGRLGGLARIEAWYLTRAWVVQRL